jgi:hypothetical protein
MNNVMQLKLLARNSTNRQREKLHNKTEDSVDGVYDDDVPWQENEAK